jgi:rubrerythrin
MSEINDLLEAAMYKEIASQAFYTAGQKLTDDPGAIALMKELAVQESEHIEALKKLKEKGIKDGRFFPAKVPDLMLSAHLTGGDSVEGAGLQETLIFAIKKEQQALDFYANMMSIMKDSSAKSLCRRLVSAELGHKYKLETKYEELFLGED